MTPKEVAQAFIDRINAQDVEGLYALMSEDHRFIEVDGYVHQGREAMRKAWQDFFSMVPDYRIDCEQILSDKDVAAVFGRTRGTYTRDGKLKPENRWEVPAAWRVVVQEGKVAEWCLYADILPLRQIMAKETAVC